MPPSARVSRGATSRKSRSCRRGADLHRMQGLALAGPAINRFAGSSGVTSGHRCAGRTTTGCRPDPTTRRAACKATTSRSRFQPLAHRAAPLTARSGRKNATDPAVDSVCLGVRYLAALIACRRTIALQPESLAAGPARTSLLLLGRVRETIAEKQLNGVPNAHVHRVLW